MNNKESDVQGEITYILPSGKRKTARTPEELRDAQKEYWGEYYGPQRHEYVYGQLRDGLRKQFALSHTPLPPRLITRAKKGKR